MDLNCPWSIVDERHALTSRILSPLESQLLHLLSDDFELISNDRIVLFSINSVGFYELVLNLVVFEYLLFSLVLLRLVCPMDFIARFALSRAAFEEQLLPFADLLLSYVERLLVHVGQSE